MVRSRSNSANISFVAAASAAGVRRIRTGIFAANTASLALHTRAGFTITDRVHRPDPHRARRSIYVMELDPTHPHRDRAPHPHRVR